MLLRVFLLLSLIVGRMQAQTPMANPNPVDAVWVWTVTATSSPANEATIRQAGTNN